MLIVRRDRAEARGCDEHHVFLRNEVGEVRLHQRGSFGTPALRLLLLLLDDELFLAQGRAQILTSLQAVVSRLRPPLRRVLRAAVDALVEAFLARGPPDAARLVRVLLEGAAELASLVLETLRAHERRVVVHGHGEATWLRLPRIIVLHLDGERDEATFVGCQRRWLVTLRLVLCFQHSVLFFRGRV